ncbi:hypothetical protein INR49_024802 [Caranx melampygus]|nr:hypothetical protein INR49_024802 [Caranx melampygus]
MMKCVLSLVVLLHLCNTMALDLNLNNEIIKSLEDLTKLYKKDQIRISSPHTVKVPSWRMCNHAAECVKEFKTQLLSLLSDNVTVHNDIDSKAEDTLEVLEGNLESLQQEGNKTGHHCNMMHNDKPLEVFNKYVHFLKKLNNGTSNNTSTTTNQ